MLKSCAFYIGMLSFRVEIGVLLCLSVLSSDTHHSDMMPFKTTLSDLTFTTEHRSSDMPRYEKQ